MGCSKSKALDVELIVPNEPAPQKDAGVVEQASLDRSGAPTDNVMDKKAIAPAIVIEIADSEAAIEDSDQPKQSNAATDGGASPDSAQTMNDIVKAAKTACRLEIERFSVFDAEKVLMDAVASLDLENGPGSEEQRKAFETLRQSEEYIEVLAQLRDYEQRVEFAMQRLDAAGGSEWKLAGKHSTDFKALGMTLSPEADAALNPEDRFFLVYWRMLDGRIEIQITVVLPTRPSNMPEQFSQLTACVSQLCENEFIPNWNPVVPTPPANLQPRAPFFNVWSVLDKFIVWKKAHIQVERMFFNPETGAFLHVAKDMPQDHDLWRQHPPPSSHALDPDTLDFSVVVLPQEHTTFMQFSLVQSMKSPPPQWVVKMFMEWVVPTSGLRAMARLMPSLKVGTAQRAVIDEDRYGVYALAARLNDTAVRLDRERNDGVKLNASNKPPPELVSRRARSLTKFEDKIGCGTGAQ